MQSRFWITSIQTSNKGIGLCCSLIGPNCQLVTPNHPINYMERRKPVVTGFPISIGEDCWLRAGGIVCLE